MTKRNIKSNRQVNYNNLQNNLEVDKKDYKFEKKKLLNESKIKAISMYLTGYTNTQIASAIKKDHSTIRRWISKHNKTGNVFVDLPKSGRKKKINNKLLASIRKKITKERNITYRELTRSLQGIKKISKSTVAREMKARGIKYKPRTVFPLSNNHIENRFQYAYNMRRMNLSNIIFTNKTNFYINRNKVKWYKYHEEDKLFKLKSNSNLSVIVWGGISYQGKLGLVEVKEALTSKAYIELLNNNLVPEANKLYENKDWQFQQDNTPAYTSKKVEKWFKDKNIKLIKQPAMSPDMNPIKLIWIKIKTFVKKKNPKNKKELLKYINLGWSRISLNNIRKAIGYFKNSICKAIEKANGKRVDIRSYRYKKIDVKE